MIETLLLVLVLFVVGIPMLAAFGAMGLIGAESRSRKKAMARKREVFAELFDGSPPTVRYNSKPITTLPAKAVMDEAARRGYTLTTNDGGDLWFTRS